VNRVSRFRVSRFRVSGFRVSGFRVSGFRVSGFRVRGFLRLAGRIIKGQRISTLKGSPLSNRRSARPADRTNSVYIDPNGVAHCHRWGTLSGCLMDCISLSAGRTDPRLLRGNAFSVFNCTKNGHSKPFQRPFMPFRGANSTISRNNPYRFEGQKGFFAMFARSQTFQRSIYCPLNKYCFVPLSIFLCPRK